MKAILVTLFASSVAIASDYSQMFGEDSPDYSAMCCDDSPEPVVVDSFLGPNGKNSRPRAIVFGASWCGPCRRLKKDVKAGKWSEFRWEFINQDTQPSIYRKQLKEFKGIVSAFPTIWWPDSGTQGFHARGYSQPHIRGVINWHKKNPPKPAKKPTEPRLATYPTRESNWTFPGTTHDELIEHILTHDNHSGKFSAEWLRRLTFEELKALHSDDHEDRVQKPAETTRAAIIRQYSSAC